MAVVIPACPLISFFKANTTDNPNIFSVKEFLLKPDYIPDEGIFFLVGYSLRPPALLDPARTHIWTPLYPGTTLDISLNWLSGARKHILGVHNGFKPLAYECDDYKLVVDGSMLREDQQAFYCDQLYRKLFENIASLGLEGLIKPQTPYQETPVVLCSGPSDFDTRPDQCFEYSTIRSLSLDAEVFRSELKFYTSTLCQGKSLEKTKYAIVFDSISERVSNISGTLGSLSERVCDICENVRSFFGWTK